MVLPPRLRKKLKKLKRRAKQDRARLLRLETEHATAQKQLHRLADDVGALQAQAALPLSREAGEG